MSKYIIEIEEKPLCVFDKDTQTYFPRLWRVKGFNSLVFDEDGLSRLEELNSDYINEHYGQLQDEAYQRGYKDCETRYCSFDACPNRQAEYRRGLNDAWEAARKIIHMSEGALLDTFTECYSAVCTALQVLLKYDASEAIEKLKVYEEKQDDKIEVGDTVDLKDAVSDKGGGIVTKIFDNDCCYIVWYDGSGGAWAKDMLVKTGKHIDIASILKEINDES